MRRLSGRWAIAGVAAGLVGVLGNLSWRAAAQEAPAAASAPTTDPATTPSRPNILPTTSRPGVSATNTMAFRFENATVDEVLAEMSARFGFIIIKSVVIPYRVTIIVPQPVHADEAMRLINDVLVPLGYATLESHTGEEANGKTSLRIAGLAEVKKSNVPVLVGANPDDIPVSNNIITQIIPVKTMDAARLRSDLSPFMSAEADVTANAGANCIVMTDTAARVRRFVAIVAAMDQLAAERPKVANPGVAGATATQGRVRGAWATSGPLIGGDVPAWFLQAGTGEVVVPRAAIVVPTDGILEKLEVGDGATVKAGQVVAELDAGMEQAELTAALARLEVAKVQAARSEATGVAAETAIGKAAVAVEQALVDRHREALAALKIKAPFDGVLTRVDVRPGQYVRTGTTLTEVVGPKEVEVMFSPPSIAVEFKVGTKFTFRVGGAMTAYACEVSYMPPAEARPGGREWRARFTGSTERLKPGMQGSIEVDDP